MMDPAPRFPFGRPLEARTPPVTATCRLFLLGAYPNALHVEWRPPAPFQRVAALAVDNEPSAFWTGQDEEAQIDAWSKRIGWRPEWGTVGPVGPLNGSSGLWLDQKVLSPLVASRAETRITDCLDTYRFSRGQEEVVTGKYEPFAAKLGLPWPGVPATLRHPDEDQIVQEALECHHERLVNELHIAQPHIVVTLGNAALRVFAALVGLADPETLRPNRDYGNPIAVTLGGKAATWLPLAHPGQRSKEWLAAHARWIRAKTKPPTA